MRVEPKRLDSYAWYLRPFFWNQRRRYGAVLDSALLWARSPRLFLGVALLYGMIDRRSSPIDPQLRSLITRREILANGPLIGVTLLELRLQTVQQRAAAILPLRRHATGKLESCRPRTGVREIDIAVARAQKTRSAAGAGITHDDVRPPTGTTQYPSLGSVAAP